MGAVALGTVNTLRRESPAESYASGEHLLRVIRAVHDCAVGAAEGPERDSGGVEFATCMDGDPNEASPGDVDVWLYQYGSQVDRALELGLEQRANAAGEPWKSMRFIAGPNWLVRTYSAATAEKLHARLGGRFR